MIVTQPLVKVAVHTGFLIVGTSGLRLKQESILPRRLLRELSSRRAQKFAAFPSKCYDVSN